ncbi:unnamed protein product [Gordionus sp. m RMFG-2023]
MQEPDPYISDFENIREYFFRPLDPEITMTPADLIKSKGYPYENYEVTTEDGFVLQLHRIPFGKKRNNASNLKASVYLQHGLLCTSCDFLMNLENQSLAFIMADNDLDVWLGDTRGNKYSRKHIKYTTNDTEFWDWSFDEIAKYDLPAVIDFIIKVTNRDHLYYVGHSQGSMVALAHFSQNPEMSNKVKMFFAMAPVAYLKNIRSPIRLFAPITQTYEIASRMFGRKEFLPSNHMVQWIAMSVCPYGISLKVCSHMLYLIGGPYTGNFNESRIPVIYGHYPAGTSVRNIAHFGQSIRTGDFRKYDYGFFKNLIKYGKYIPPSYDVTQMTIPTMIFWGLKDLLAVPKDVKKLIPLIQNLVGNYKSYNSNHFDFVFGINAAKEYYSVIIQAILDTEFNSSFKKTNNS